MLIGVVGDLGSGKNVFLTLVAYSSPKEVLSNFWINLPNCSLLDITDLIDLGENKDILLDEAYTWLESRVSSYYLNRYFSYIIFQSRKRTINIYCAEQLFRTIDLRFRDLVHKIVKCERIKGKKSPENKELWDFKYSILDVSSGKIKTFILKYEKAKRYFNLFDTKQIIEPHNKELLTLELLKNRPKELYKKIEAIAIELQNKVKHITHASVKMGLLKLGYDTNYESLVYSYLKDLEE